MKASYWLLNSEEYFISLAICVVKTRLILMLMLEKHEEFLMEILKTKIPA
jgi:hypothetical protein